MIISTSLELCECVYLQPWCLVMFPRPSGQQDISEYLVFSSSIQRRTLQEFDCVCYARGFERLRGLVSKRLSKDVLKLVSSWSCVPHSLQAELE